MKWSPEGFTKAKNEDKALLVYIHHTGCYWCEQMQKESFEDAEITGLIERDFIALKVDSYERPDIGRHCHALFTKMTGREANYPLVLFLSPDQVPLYAATYMPDRDRDGMMGVRETVELVARKYETQRTLLLKKGREIQAAMDRPKQNIQATKLKDTVAEIAIEQMKRLYDTKNGGFGTSPKFPRQSVLQLGMDIYEKTSDSALRTLLQHTLSAMTEGGLRDEEAGGFFRYCSDVAWQRAVEGKVLYDNASMVEVLLRASEILGEGHYQRIALQTVEFMQTEMRREGLLGAFYGDGAVRDTRVILSWNAMAIKSLFLAGEVDNIYRQLAIESLAVLLEQGMQQGQLYHSFMPGKSPTTEAFLEDYAYLSEALLLAYAQTKESHYLDKASELINEALKRFFNQGFWLYDAETFQMEDIPEDTLYSSALAVMAGVLQDAAKCIDPAYGKFVQRTLEVHSYALMREPLSMPQLSRVLLASV